MNIMYDPRVVRGNVLSSQRLGTASRATAGTASSSQRTKRVPSRPRAAEPSPFAIGIPEPVHEPVDLTPFLTESEPPRRVDSVSTQTEAFLDEPPCEPYRPAKSGMDASTQIEQGELFDFDEEVAPLVDVLASKTLEQALMECAEEAELEQLFRARHERETASVRDTEGVRALEADAKAQAAVQRRRLKQARAHAKLQRQCAAKVAARAVARRVTREAIDGCFRDLRFRGQFRNATWTAVESMVLPPLMDRARQQTEQYIVARQCVDAMLQRGLATLRARTRERRAEKARLEEEEAKRKPVRVSVLMQGFRRRRRRRRAEMEVFLSRQQEDQEQEEETVDDVEEDDPRWWVDEEVPSAVLGPIRIARIDSVGNVEDRIMQWIRTRAPAQVRIVVRGRLLRLAPAKTRDPLPRDSSLESLPQRELRELMLLNLPDPDYDPDYEEDEEEERDSDDA